MSATAEKPTADVIEDGAQVELVRAPTGLPATSFRSAAPFLRRPYESHAVRWKPQSLYPREGVAKGIVANKFDYSQDPRTNLVLIAYKGRVEQRRNHGIKVAIDALHLLQKGEVTIDDITEDAGYIVNADISALKPFITK